MSPGYLACAAIWIGLNISPTFALVDYDYQAQEGFFDLEEEASEQPPRLDELDELQRHPLDVNRASADEFARLPWVSPLQARAIIDYRKEHGAFRNLHGLCRVPGIFPGLFEEVKPFLTVSAPSPRRLSLDLRSRIGVDRPLSAGYSDSNPDRCFLGSPYRFYNRFRLCWSDWAQAGVIARKDAGESSPLDFLGYNVFLRMLPLAGQAVAGNFQLELGQGLLFAPASAGLRSPDLPFDTRKKASRLRPYLGSSETAALRGLAIACSGQRADAIAFISDRRLDANANPDGTIRSITEAGLHRNRSETSDSRRLREQLLGGRLGVGAGRNLRIGTTVCRVTYSPSFSATSHEGFDGSGIFLSSVDFDGALREVSFFGELGRSMGHGAGYLAGSLLDLARIRICAIYRRYDPGFYSPLSRGFARSGDQNENGFYVAATGEPWQKTRVSFSRDIYRHPGPGVLEKMATEGEESTIHLGRQFGEGLQISLTERLSIHQGSETQDDGNRSGSAARVVSRLGVTWKPSPTFEFDGRAEVVRSRPAGAAARGRGEMVRGGLTWKGKTGSRLSLRIIDFYIDSYGSRIYESEQDLPGLMTNRMLQGRGQRGYCVLRSKIGKYLLASAKVAVTHKYGVTSMGSGLDASPGDTEYECAAQVDWEW